MDKRLWINQAIGFMDERSFRRNREGEIIEGGYWRNHGKAKTLKEKPWRIGGGGGVRK